MAVAGLHNVSSFGPSLFVESQSSGSSLWEEPQVRPSTRASSLLQMWRELEDEHVVSPSYRQRYRRSNGSDSDCTSIVASVGQGSNDGDDNSEYADESENHGITTLSEMNLEDSNSIISGQSSDLGDKERQRVRQVFGEWMNSGAKGHSTDGFPLNNTGEQYLGENVCERVRTIEEWVQTAARHGNNNGSLRDEVTEVDSQIEQLRDGLTSRPEIGARRPIRRLCGRQTLLDLLLRAKSERNRELRDLSEQRPVSDFAHHNRIQAFLRGRFLGNKILITDKRPSMAVTELGLLRQRSTVSDLREGFLSKLHNSTSIPGNSAEVSSSLSDETNSEAVSTSIRGVAAETHTASVSEIDADENRSRNEFVSRVTEVEDSALDCVGNAEVSLGIKSSCSVEQPTFDSEASDPSSHFDQNNVIVNDEPSLEIVDIDYSGSLADLHERFEPRSDASYVHEVDGDTADMEGNTNEEFDGRDALTLEEEAQDSEIRIDNNSWHQLTGVAFTEWTDANREDTTSNQWYRETSDYEQDQMQGPHEVWPNHNFQDAVDSWLDMPTVEVNGSVGRMNTFYFPDDDNVQSMELRELFSQRRVSSLLRSGFRESLDQVLQSHMERQGHASGDWELDTTSSPTLIEPDQEQLNGEQTLASSDGSEINQFDPSSIHITAFQPLWDEVLPGANWPCISTNQHTGTEWEVIKELRIDVARLQQRMNNMQSMLEACMELQIELQRSVHQEVSAALNQPIRSRGADSWESNILHHESKWDFVRKGICCLCCDSNIDSLLYRCGHMCTCSKCAEGLVQSSGKCPMCEAPIVEVVRAYFIH